MPSADGSTLALMSRLSAPASGAPCGTGIIRMADEKVLSSKRAGKGGQEHKVEHPASPCPWRVTPSRRVTTQQEGNPQQEGNHPAGRDQYLKKKGKRFS